MKRTSSRGFVAKVRAYKKSASPAERARLAMREASWEEARKQQLAIRLIAASFAAVEVGSMTGLPIVTVQVMRKGFGETLPRPGRMTENTPAFVFSTSKTSATCAIFVKALRTALLAAGKPLDNGLQGCGEEFISAVDYTHDFCDLMPNAEKIPARRMLAIALDWQAGELRLVTCNKCGCEHLKSQKLVALNGCRPTTGECPVCNIRAYKIAEARRAAVADLQQKAEEALPKAEASAKKSPVIFDLA